MHSLTYTLTRGDDEIELEIEYSVSPYDPGCSCGPPEFCDPPSGGEVEELTAYRDGEPFQLTRDENEEVEKRIYETHDYDDDGYDYD